MIAVSQLEGKRETRSNFCCQNTCIITLKFSKYKHCQHTKARVLKLWNKQKRVCFKKVFQEYIFKHMRGRSGSTFKEK